MTTNLTEARKALETSKRQLREAEESVLTDLDPRDIALAEYLHKEGCHIGHEDGRCSWSWDEHFQRTNGQPIDWSTASRRNWLLKARTLREQDIETPEQIAALKQAYNMIVG